MCGRRDAVQFRAAQGGSAAGPTVRRFLSACEGSWTAGDTRSMGKVTGSLHVNIDDNRSKG